MSGAVIAFGLVTIACSTGLAASSKAVSFTTLTAEGHKVRGKQFDATTNQEVGKENLVRAYEYAKGKFVTLSEDELASLDAGGQNEVEIKEFVPANAVSSHEVEKSYYLSPEPGAEKGYALLTKTMLARKVVAVAQWMQRSREHLVILRPHQEGDHIGLILQMVFYGSEVRSFQAMGVSQSKARVSDAEAALAEKLLDMLLVGDFDRSKYEDHYAIRMRELVARKLTGEQIQVPPESEKRPTNVIDLTALLAKSLEDQAARKAS
jgi:DNA end-binding protein Ku